MASTSVWVLGGFDVAVWFGVLASGLAIDFLDRTVLVAVAHPILEMAV
jgi:hypothetical protein